MLQPIARDVFVAMTQLMEYYFINVHHMFTQDLRSESHHAVPTFKFTSYLDRVRGSLIKPEPIPQSESVGLNSINKSLNKTSINNFLNDLNKSSSSPTVRHPISDPDNQTGVSQEQPPADRKRQRRPTHLDLSLELSLRARKAVKKWQHKSSSDRCPTHFL